MKTNNEACLHNCSSVNDMQLVVDRLQTIIYCSLLLFLLYFARLSKLNIKDNTDENALYITSDNLACSSKETDSVTSEQGLMQPMAKCYKKVLLLHSKINGTVWKRAVNA